MTAASIDLSIIVPCFNEERRLGQGLPKIVEFFGARGFEFEVIVIDDGSRDDTIGVAERFEDARVRLLRHEVNRGKGAAVRGGVLASRGRLILVSDVDLSTPLEEFDRLADAIDRGADIAIGSRALDRHRVEVAQSFLRDRLGRFFNLCIRALGVHGIRDTQCGFKLFDGPIARRLFPHLVVDRWIWDVECLHLAKRLGLDISEVSVRWRNDDDSRVNVLRDAPRVLFDLLRLRLRAVASRQINVRTPSPEVGD